MEDVEDVPEVRSSSSISKPWRTSKSWRKCALCSLGSSRTLLVRALFPVRPCSLLETSDKRVSVLHPQFLSSQPASVIHARLSAALTSLGAEVSYFQLCLPAPLRYFSGAHSRNRALNNA